MQRTTPKAGQQASTGLHPQIYRIVLGLAGLMITAAWCFFRPGTDVTLPLIVVTGVIGCALTIPWLLRTVAGNVTSHRRRRPHRTLRRWLSDDFETWQYRLSGAEAAVNVLLPLFAVSVGLTILTIEFGLVGH